MIHPELMPYYFFRAKEKLECLLKCPFYKLRYYWYFLWIRKNEFHKSLDIDIMYLLYCKPDFNKYYSDLSDRRKTAHLK